MAGTQPRYGMSPIGATHINPNPQVPTVTKESIQNTKNSNNHPTIPKTILTIAVVLMGLVTDAGQAGTLLTAEHPRQYSFPPTFTEQY